MHSRRCSEHDPVGPGTIATERNRYFTGKSMTAREFTAEQRYFLSRHWLHNRLLHGWGVVCGLAVVPHPVEECRDRWVVVKAGIAIDCFGRELVLLEDTPVRFRPDDPPAGLAGIAPAGPQPWQPPPEGLLVVVRYREDCIEPVPLLYDECGCAPDRSEYGRVREVAGIEVVPFDEVGADCWLEPGGEQEPCRYKDDCDDRVPGPAPACIEPARPCGDLVPVARLLFDPDFRIDDLGVRRLSTPRDYLTHITGVNWTHGRSLTVQELQEGLGGQLRVYFDRPLQVDDRGSSGIDQFTFVVQCGIGRGALEFVSFLDPPDFVEDADGCYAVFPIDDDHFRRGGRTPYLGNYDIYVTLECDFVLDCHGTPVDGDHLRGRLPSGNGRAGGVFKSWFHVDG